jgi:cytochrome c-type biogenesis protein CcmH
VDSTTLATFAAAAALAIVALIPLLLALRRAAPARGRRDSALALHRAQLVELDRELAAGRLAAVEHASATLEVQRRLLAIAATEEPAPRRASRAPLLVTLVLVPLAALLLYLRAGQPDMPAAPLAARIVAAETQAHRDDALIATLRARLATLDPQSEAARKGYVLLGRAEAARGHYAAAAAAWRIALAQHWEPTLAAEAAEAQTRADGRVTPATEAEFRRALAAAPADAPWRKMVEGRLIPATKNVDP